MITLRETAYAKLNLTLDILGKREDGYHDLVSIMQQISLCDEVQIDLQTGKPWKVFCDTGNVPSDETNLAWKAAAAFYRHVEKDPGGVEIRITKRIPMQAGLAGGSADAAAVLLALNKHEGFPCSGEKLLEIAAQVGSDVPFCVHGGRALAEGRGERLTKLPPMPSCWYCVVKPAFSVSTPSLFAAYDRAETNLHPHTDAMLKAETLTEIASLVGNVMEPLVEADHPEYSEIRKILKESGALGCAMTGSGSAYYGMFARRKEAEAAQTKLKEKFLAFVCENVD